MRRLLGVPASTKSPASVRQGRKQSACCHRSSIPKKCLITTRLRTVCSVWFKQMSSSVPSFRGTILLRGAIRIYLYVISYVTAVASEKEEPIRQCPRNRNLPGTTRYSPQLILTLARHRRICYDSMLVMLDQTADPRDAGSSDSG
jgi:hypothetical protein